MPFKKVRFDPPAHAVGGVEVTTLKRIRERMCPLERHAVQVPDFHLLLRVESGRSLHMVDFRSYDLAPYDVLWVRAGQVQRWGSLEEIEGTAILFVDHTLGADVTAALRDITARNSTLWPAAARPGSAISAAINQVQHFQGSGPAHTQSVDGLLAAYVLRSLVLGLVASGPGADQPPGDALFERFRNAVDENFTRFHRIQEYADLLGYSSKTLTRLVNQYTGTSPKEFIDDRVVLEARRLLVHDDRPVAGVACALGFDDPANFSRFFRRRTGQSPAEFRLSVRPVAAVL